MRCMKCWRNIVPLTNHLWCKECRGLVDSELRGESDKPFRFYFTYYNKCRKQNTKSAKDAENS